MAHFALIGPDDIVDRVVVIDNLSIIDSDGLENEEIGAELCRSLVADGEWIQTSYHNRIRRRFAGPGYHYLRDLDIFVMPQPYPSWMLDLDSVNDWIPPVALPDDKTQLWVWDENNKQWIGIPKPIMPSIEVLDS